MHAIYFHQLTSSIGISQLLANHCGISAVPEVITHCPPLVIDAHLHSTLILIGASHQTNTTICTDATSIDYRNEKHNISVQLQKPEGQVRTTDTATSWSTLTSHSSIFWVATVTVDSWAVRAVSEIPFTATAANIIQEDWTSSNTKVSTTEGYSIYWHIIYNNELKAWSVQCTCYWLWVE